LGDGRCRWPWVAEELREEMVGHRWLAAAMVKQESLSRGKKQRQRKALPPRIVPAQQVLCIIRISCDESVVCRRAVITQWPQYT